MRQPLDLSAALQPQKAFAPAGFSRPAWGGWSRSGSCAGSTKGSRPPSSRGASRCPSKMDSRDSRASSRSSSCDQSQTSSTCPSQDLDFVGDLQPSRGGNHGPKESTVARNGSAMTMDTLPFFRQQTEGAEATVSSSKTKDDDSMPAPHFDSKTKYLLREHIRRSQAIAESTAALVKTSVPTQACKVFMSCADRLWDSPVAVELCLRPSHAPRLRRRLAGECDGGEGWEGAARGTENELPPLGLAKKECDALHCTMLSPEGTGNYDRARLLGSSGTWLDESFQSRPWRARLLQDHDALRSCLHKSSRVSDRLPRGYSVGKWLFAETARAAKSVGAPRAHLYWPLRGRDGCIGVLHLSSTNPDEFSNAKQESFAPLAEAMGMQLCSLQLQVLLDRERQRQQALANDYRSMLENMLPPHVIDELNQMRSPSSIFLERNDSGISAAGGGGGNGHGEDFGCAEPEARVPTPDGEASPVTSQSLSPEGSPRRRSRRSRLGQHSAITSETSTASSAAGGSNKWLPSSRIVERLDKLGYAEYHDCVAILFTDIKGFTSMSERSDPGYVMVMLDDLFGRFDDIVDAYAPVAYKVETIGDAYMVAFGLFEQEADGAKAAINAVQVAANMIRAAREVEATLSDGSVEKVEIRAGIALGQIMSGIIGKKMPRYCMFGDTVNTASRMESTGTAGMVHVTEKVREACVSSAEGASMRFEHSGGREVKGKGFMDTYLLEPNQVLGLPDTSPGLRPGRARCQKISI